MKSDAVIDVYAGTCVDCFGEGKSTPSYGVITIGPLRFSLCKEHMLDFRDKLDSCCEEIENEAVANAMSEAF